MAGPPVIDYTNRDYESIVTALLDEAQRRLPEWTDRSANDPGRVLLDLFAYAADIMLYYQDRIANESFLATARERESVVDLLRLVGYELRTAAPAATELTLTIKNDRAAALTIAPGAQFATLPAGGGEKLRFTYAGPKPITVPLDGVGGSVTHRLPVVHADLVAGEAVGRSDGQANQRFRLLQGPVLLAPPAAIWDRMEVRVDEGAGPVPWLRKETLLYSKPGDPHYMVRVDGQGLATLYFGDNRFGRVPLHGAPVTATYLTGGGAAGNVGARTIVKVESGLSDPGAVSVINLVSASGGADAEAPDEARLYGPPLFRSLGRAVTEADYVALAEAFPGVARARTLVRGWNNIDVYVLPQGGLPLANDLRQRLQTYLDERRMVTTRLWVRSPLPVRINLQAQIQVQPTFYAGDVEMAVRTALGELLSTSRVGFGSNVYLSKVYEAIESVEGVEYVTVTDFVRGGSGTGMARRGIIEVHPNEVPELGALHLEMRGGYTP